MQPLLYLELARFPTGINPEMGFEGEEIFHTGSLNSSATNPRALSITHLRVYAIVPKGDSIFVNFDPIMSPWNYNGQLL